MMDKLTRTRKPKTSKTIDDIYKYYVESRLKLGINKDKIIPKMFYRRIVEELMQEVIDKAIYKGFIWKIPKLGYIGIKKKTKKLALVDGKIKKSQLKIDWGTTNKNKKKLIEEGKELWNEETQTGNKYIVYFDCPYYLRWAWFKINKTVQVSKVKNFTIYKFEPTSTNSNKGNPIPGTKAKLVSANLQNKNLHFKYLHY